MAERANGKPTWVERRIPAIGAIVLAVAVGVYAWIGISESRKDSLGLLVTQGAAFTEALAQAAAGAIEAEAFYDYLVHLRFEEVFVTVSQLALDPRTAAELTEAALLHDLDAIYLCDLEGNVLATGAAPAWEGLLPQFVQAEVRTLGDNPQTNYVLLLEPATREHGARHYYLQIANTLDRIAVLVADAQYYVEALRQTQIGYLVQRMAEEPGVVYIIYQSTDGIIFSSRRTGPLLAIESDPFLTQALDADTIMHRTSEFQGERVLELVRPFATSEYPFGLFRVGLSLGRYYSVSRRFDLQMAALSAALFGVLLFGLLYLAARRKRRELGRQYTDIKSLTDVIFDRMRTGVAAVDDRGVITLANRAFEQIVGAAGVLGRNWDDALTAPALARENLRRWMAAGEEKELTAAIGDREKTLVLAVSAIGQRRDEGMVIVLYDVTRLKEYERRALRRARLSELGDLAAGVAHEIRNPLNTISIAAQRLAAEFTPTANREEFVGFTGQIRAETRRLNDIITRFLALAREEKKGRQKVALDRLIADAVVFLGLEARKIGIALEAECEPGLTLEADPDELRQVLTNLFNNAKEALAGQPGRIRVQARRAGDGRVALTFEDSGPGIAEDLRERVFAPYFTTKEAGTGLGLPTVYRIVSDLGGEVRVERSDLGGARFVIAV
ncbi:MAG TPA: ATP-binding protein [candidate division Zixibacteria bacterium]|nr:ATP-binding protein [candidate division Zixibacteria bacterium]